MGITGLLNMSKSKLALSIVIPCATDVRIADCLNSIDENVEVVVALNGPSKEVVKIVNKYHVKVLVLPERNLPRSLNAGIEKASNQKIILMDSDCVFHPRAIRKMYLALENHMVAKGTVIFKHHNLTSLAISKVRDYTNADTVKAYNPFLGLRKDIKKFVGGFIFDDGIYWTEDADLNKRIVAAGMKIKSVPDATAYHPALTLKQDLSSAFKYGIGKRIRVEKKTAKGIGSNFSKIFDLGRKKGILSATYFFFWNCFYTAGYYYQIINDPYGTREK